MSEEDVAVLARLRRDGAPRLRCVERIGGRADDGALPRARGGGLHTPASTLPNPGRQPSAVRASLRAGWAAQQEAGSGWCGRCPRCEYPCQGDGGGFMVRRRRGCGALPDRYLQKGGALAPGERCG
jgi:hypothetical protein